MGRRVCSAVATPPGGGARVAADVTAAPPPSSGCGAAVDRQPRTSHRVDSQVSTTVRTVDQVDGTTRGIVWVEVGGETAVRVPRRPAVVDDVRHDRARRHRRPRRGHAAGRRARVDRPDIVEGIAALEGWGRLAKALVDCSGDRADDRRRRRPGRVRPGAAARRRRPRRDDRGELRVRQRPGDGRGVHRRADPDRRARRRRRARPPHRRAAASSSPTARRRSNAVARPARLPPVERRRGAGPMAERRPGRPAVSRRPAS